MTTPDWLTELRVTPAQLAELKVMCQPEPTPPLPPLWPAILGIPVVVVDDPEQSTLYGRTWTDVYEAAKERSV